MYYSAKDVVSRALKYLIEGTAVAVAAFYIPKKGKMSLEEVVMVGVTAASVLAVLDTFAPEVGSAARFGAGFGVGGKLVR